MDASPRARCHRAPGQLRLSRGSALWSRWTEWKGGGLQILLGGKPIAGSIPVLLSNPRYARPYKSPSRYAQAYLDVRKCPHRARPDLKAQRIQRRLSAWRVRRMSGNVRIQPIPVVIWSYNPIRLCRARSLRHCRRLDDPRGDRPCGTYPVAARPAHSKRPRRLPAGTFVRWAEITPIAIAPQGLSSRCDPTCSPFIHLPPLRVEKSAIIAAILAWPLRTGRVWLLTRRHELLGVSFSASLAGLLDGANRLRSSSHRHLAGLRPLW